MKSRGYLHLESLLMVGLPVYLALTYPVLFRVRLVAMVLWLVYVGLVCKRFHFTRKSLGFLKNKLHGFKETVPALLCVLIGVGIVVTIFPQTLLPQGMLTIAHPVPRIWYMLLYILISVPLQEIVFRSYYVSRLELVSKNRLFILLYSSFIFMFIHIPFGKLTVDIGTFILGIWLAHLFLKYRNLYLLLFVHAIIGGLVIYLSL